MKLNAAHLHPRNKDVPITKFPSNLFSKSWPTNIAFPFFSSFRVGFPSDLSCCLYFKKSGFLTFWRLIYYLRMVFLLPGCQQIVQNCVSEIAEIIFRPNSINITFYYPRKNHKTLVTASCIPTLWKTFITSVSIFMSVPQFSQHYLEQLVIMLLDCHPFCTTKLLISSVDTLEVSSSESARALCILYLWSVVHGGDKMFQFFSLQGM